MPKKILLIENDSAFAGTLSESLEASGFDVRVAPEGKAGLDLAREWSPEAIVLCVELPGMSGYLVCQKLRKDDGTKAIPLVLTSAEATADTFEKHKALKVRADAYLLKPFVPGALLEALAEVGLQAEAPPPSTTDELALQPVSTDELPSLELEALPDEPAPAAAAPASVDDDLAFLDEAFEGIAAPGSARPPPEPAEAPPEEDDLSAAAAALPEEDESPGRAALDGMELSTDEDPLAQLDESPAADELPELPEPPAPAPAPARAPSADMLRAAGIPLLDDERPTRAAPSRNTVVGMPSPIRAPAPQAAPPPSAPPPAPAPRPVVDTALTDRLQRELSEARAAVAARDAELRHLRGQADDAAQRADAAESTAAEREAELASVRARLDAISGQARKSEQDLKGAREEARRAAAELESLRARAQELESVRARVEELERELESTRTELVVARGEVEGARGEVEAARGEVEARTGELQRRIAELEAQSAKNEERVFKAYQKIKGDEKVKDKVRKAIAIAAQLLEEGLPAEPAAPAEKSKVS